jgi:phage baseplate assembly protein W
MATAITNIGISRYSDLDLNFTTHPVKKDINTLYDERAVITSVKNLLLMNHYEKPFHPEVGSNVRKMLFDNMDSISASVLEKEIRQTIINFEPRVTVNQLTVSPDYDNNRFSVTMNFIVGNKTNPINIEFFLARER